MKICSLLSALVLAGGIALSGFFIANGIIAAKRTNRFVSVKGLAELTVKSDQAIWEIRFNNADDDLTNIYQAIEKSQETVKSFLIAQGFNANNIIYQPIVVTDNLSQNYGNNNPNVKRYSASAAVTLNTNDVDKAQLAAQKTGELVKQGVLVAQSTIQYTYTDLNSIKPKMLVDATNNAREAGLSFAKNSQSELGQIKNASQGLFTITDLTNTYSSNMDVMKKVRVVTTVDYFLK